MAIKLLKNKLLLLGILVFSLFSLGLFSNIDDSRASSSVRPRNSIVLRSFDSDTPPHHKYDNFTVMVVDGIAASNDQNSAKVISYCREKLAPSDRARRENIANKVIRKMDSINSLLIKQKKGCSFVDRFDDPSLHSNSFKYLGRYLEVTTQGFSHRLHCKGPTPPIQYEPSPGNLSVEILDGSWVEEPLTVFSNENFLDTLLRTRADSEKKARQYFGEYCSSNNLRCEVLGVAFGSHYQAEFSTISTTPYLFVHTVANQTGTSNY